MNATKPNIDWSQLERDVARLFSAAPLPSPDYFSKEELFAGRTSEVRRLIEAVRDPAKHILLYGERGTGKTTISNNFWPKQHKFDQPTIVARIQAFPSDDFSSLWLKVLEALKIAAENHSKDLRADFDSVSPDLVKREFQKLRKNWITIIIIDEFDRIRSEQSRELTANFLKSLHDDGVNVTILLIGVADNVEELIAGHQSLRRVLSLVKLERMSALDLVQILTKRLQLMQLSFTGDARSIIVGLSCGLPYYVQTLGRFAALNAIEGKRIGVSIDNVRVAIGKFVDENGESFDEAYRIATASKRAGNIFEEVILAAALASLDAGAFFRSLEVLEILDLMLPDRKWSHFRVQRYLSLFTTDKRLKILHRNDSESDHRYRFLDAMMQPYIIMRAIRTRQSSVDFQFLLSRWGSQYIDAGDDQLDGHQVEAAWCEAVAREDDAPQETSSSFSEQPTEAAIMPAAIEDAGEKHRGLPLKWGDVRLATTRAEEPASAPRNVFGASDRAYGSPSRQLDASARVPNSATRAGRNRRFVSIVRRGLAICGIRQREP
jgi:AAA domain-containing protein